jgi:hypothetical protein
MAHWIIRNGALLPLGLLLMAAMGSAATKSDPNNPKVLSEHQISVAIDPNERIQLAAVSEIPEFKYSLLPSAGQRIDGDCYETLRPFFVRDPNHPQTEPDRTMIRGQLQAPPAEMDLDRVGAHLNACQKKLEILSKAALCKTVQWPQIGMPPRYEQDGRLPAIKPHPKKSKRDMERDDAEVPKAEGPFSISEYPVLIEQMETAGQLIALKARYEIIRGDYPEGCRWIRIGFSLSHQMATNSNPLLGLAGMASATRMLQQIEVWIQRPGSPSLFRSLGDLPDPLISSVLWEEAIRGFDSSDTGSKKSIEPTTESNRQPLVLEQQLRRFVAILGCMESIRLHAALNQQRLPEYLSEIQEVRVPVDPLTGRPFDYAIDGSWIVLRSTDKTFPGRFEFRYRVIETSEPEFRHPASFPAKPIKRPRGPR